MSKPPLIDSHSHLCHRHLQADLPDILERARSSGLKAIIIPATDLPNAHQILSLCEQHPDLYAAVGIHPCDVDSVSDSPSWIDELHQLAQHPKTVAIGETGLDYFDPPPHGRSLTHWQSWQQNVLRHHFDIAADLRLPIVLHNRESWQDLVTATQPYHGRVRAQFHCFTGTTEDALPLIAEGHLVSFTGIVSFKNSGHMAATAAQLPVTSFMLETDAPYLAPTPHRGKRCEPAYVALTAQKIAELRDQPLQTLATATTQNAIQFFNLNINP